MQNNFNNKARIFKELLMNLEEKAICNKNNLMILKGFMMKKEGKQCQMKDQRIKLSMRIKV